MCNVTSRCETKPFFVPVSLISVQRRNNYPVMQRCLGGGWDGMGRGGVVCYVLCRFFLSVLHLLANLVTQDLVPIDLGACHRKLAA